MLLPCLFCIDIPANSAEPYNITYIDYIYIGFANELCQLGFHCKPQEKRLKCTFNLFIVMREDECS